MLYIHQCACISPQQTFGDVDIDTLRESRDNKLLVVEPPYPTLAPGIMRRLGKAVKISLSAALPLLSRTAAPDGIVIGTGIGGMEDSIKFLQQIMDFEEGILAPANFVQSTANAIASQIALVTKNRSCNITHVHRGLAFEHALLDCWVRVSRQPSHQYLVGAADEISSYNFNIERLNGAYKNPAVSNSQLYQGDGPGTIAGEGAAMFLVSGSPSEAIARLDALRTLHSSSAEELTEVLRDIMLLQVHSAGPIDLLLSGDSGDNRWTHFADSCETMLGEQVPVARFKHMTGEHPSASAMACWLACHLLQTQRLPAHMLKRPEAKSPGQISNILIYNQYKGVQHSFMRISATTT
jgi:Beta-ketoacyl synthase, N-terminal domain